MKNKLLVIEYNAEETSRRQSTAHFIENESGGWCWACPPNLDQSQKAEWDRVMGVLSNVGGEDLRHVVCGIGLMDHCLGTNDGSYVEIPEPVVSE